MDVFAAVMPLVLLLSVGFGLYKLANNFSMSDEKYQYAGFIRRAAAGLIDSLIIGVIYVVVIVFLHSLAKNENFDGNAEIDFEKVNNALLIFIGFIYYTVMESSEYQATFGKRAIGLRVVDLNGKRISFLRASGRFLGKIISGFLFYIGFFMIGFTKRKQGLHDMMAECLVVGANAPFLMQAGGAAVPTAPSPPPTAPSAPPAAASPPPAAPASPFRARESGSDIQKEALRRYKAGELSEAAFLEIVKRTP